MRNVNWIQVIFHNKKSQGFADKIRRLGYPFLQKLPKDSAPNYFQELIQVNDLCNIVYFPGDSQVPPDQLLEWQKASPDSWLVSKRNDEIVGYVHVEPLSATKGNAIRDGRSHEGLVTTKDILHSEQLGPDDYIHIGSIVNLTAIKTPLKKNITLQLLAGIADRINTLRSSSKGRVHYVLAVDYPDINGKHNVTNILLDLGFENQEGWRTASDGGYVYNVYILDLNKAPTQTRFDLTKAVVKRRNKYLFNRSKQRRTQLLTIAIIFAGITLIVFIKIGWIPSIVTALVSLFSTAVSLLKDPDSIYRRLIGKK